jgi:hypothetical protein
MSSGKSEQNGYREIQNGYHQNSSTSNEDVIRRHIPPPKSRIFDERIEPNYEDQKRKYNDYQNEEEYEPRTRILSEKYTKRQAQSPIEVRERFESRNDRRPKTADRREDYKPQYSRSRPESPRSYSRPESPKSYSRPESPRSYSRPESPRGYVSPRSANARLGPRLNPRTVRLVNSLNVS